MADSPKIGQLAPYFDMPANRNRRVSSESMLGQAFVLYFYPKANTSGCTREACEFEAVLQHPITQTLPIIGVSRDTIPALDKFADKFHLNFPLASDADGHVTIAYGTWKEKSLYGRKYMGIERTTFLIDKEGHIAKVWNKVNIADHAKEVADAWYKLITS